MTKARDIMSTQVQVIGADDTLSDAARRLAEAEVGALPICDSEGRLRGMVTDRDIVVKVLATGGDPAQVKAGELAQGETVTIGADDDAEEVLATMARYQVRRLPVIDGHELVGIIALADVAQALPESRAGDVLQALSVD
jgi:CBS domain-containing protein